MANPSGCIVRRVGQMRYPERNDARLDGCGRFSAMVRIEANEQPTMRASSPQLAAHTHWRDRPMSSPEVSLPAVPDDASWH